MPMWWNNSPSVAPPGCFLWFAAAMLVVTGGIGLAAVGVFVLQLVGVIPGIVTGGCSG